MRSCYSDQTFLGSWTGPENNFDSQVMTTTTKGGHDGCNLTSFRALMVRRGSDRAQHTASNRSSSLVIPQFVAQDMSNPSPTQHSQISSSILQPKQNEARRMVKKLEKKESKAESRANRRPSIFREMLEGLRSPIQFKSKKVLSASIIRSKGSRNTDKASSSRRGRKSNIDLSFRQWEDVLHSVSGPVMTHDPYSSGDPQCYRISNESDMLGSK